MFVNWEVSLKEISSCIAHHLQCSSCCNQSKNTKNQIENTNTNTGIVPMFAEQLFKEIETKKAAGGIEFEVKLSMLEIYNEVT